MNAITDMDSQTLVSTIVSTVIGTVGLYSSYRIYRRYKRYFKDDEEWSDADSDDDDDDSQPLMTTSENLNLIKDNYTIYDAPYKMVLIVNMELSMGKGKIGAQCGHAVLGAYKRARRRAKTAVKWWETTGQKKICCKGPNLSTIKEIRNKAITAGLVTYLIADAGHTQVCVVLM